MLTIAVSACLLGEPCRYDGASKPCDAARALLELPGVEVLPVCPEVAGGLPTPRPSAEIVPCEDGFRVMNVTGADVTDAYRAGAEASLSAALDAGCTLAVLKAKSPSCGSGLVYDGTFSRRLTTGWGVTGQAMRETGLAVIDENQLVSLMECVKAASLEEWQAQVVQLLAACKGGAPEKPEPMSDQEKPVREIPPEYFETTYDELPAVTAAGAWGHFKTITRHKIEVMKLCFKVGLYAQGLKHDLSKYGPTEFLVGARFYQGYRSPNTAEREQRGFTEAWLHHKGRNKHHFEYWIDAADDTDDLQGPAPMPTRYIIEMFCDRVAACKIYQGDKYTQESAWNYYARFAHHVIMHPATRAQLERMLRLLADEGEEAALAQVKELVRTRYCEGPCARF